MINEIPINEPRKFDKAWIEEIRVKMAEKKQAKENGTIIQKEDGNPKV